MDLYEGNEYWSEKASEKIEELEKKNKQLKLICKDHRDHANDFKADCMRLEKENEQLKQRNNRQAKQLDRLYNLIEEKDWRTLSDIIDDFKRYEEQLQREMRCYK